MRLNLQNPAVTFRRTQSETKVRSSLLSRIPVAVSVRNFCRTYSTASHRPTVPPRVRREGWGWVWRLSGICLNFMAGRLKPQATGRDEALYLQSVCLRPASPNTLVHRLNHDWSTV